MMAALLFALIPFRNAVPDNPPIGSVIDFALVLHRRDRHLDRADRVGGDRLPLRDG